MVALIVSVLAKEFALVTIAILYGVGPGVSAVTELAVAAQDGWFDHEALGAILMQSISPESALAFIFALTFSIPCAATIGVLYTETKSLKWMAGASGYYTLSSLTAGVLTYQAALLIL